MTRVGKVAAHLGPKALVSVPVLAAVACAGALLPAGTAAAVQARGTLTVATTGSDTGNCQSSPCQTLGYALTQAGPNGTIVIGPGSYPESGNANVVPPALTGLRIK